jgi:predicted nucleic acid-binding protein
VRELVLDASVVVKWFAEPLEADAPAARQLLDEFERGDLVVLTTSLLLLEIVNIAGRSWGWPRDALLDLAAALDDLGFHAMEPELAGVARWVAEGLTAYDAAYVSLAESTRVPLVTADEVVLRLAPEVAHPLSTLA